MSVETVHTQSCLNKRQFRRFRNAMSIIRQMRKQGKIISKKNVYKCKFCGYYHLGHSWKMPTVKFEERE